MKAITRLGNTAIGLYGKEKQSMMAIEEMAELTVEILHSLRGRESNIVEEMADVYIMLEQMRILFENDSSRTVDEYITIKLEKLASRLRKHM